MIKYGETPEERLMKRLINYPAGYTLRGNGTETVLGSEGSICRWCKDNPIAILKYLYESGSLTNEVSLDYLEQIQEGIKEALDASNLMPIWDYKVKSDGTKVSAMTGETLR